MYFILSSVLQGMITYIDKDIILIGKPDSVSISNVMLIVVELRFFSMTLMVKQIANSLLL